jgi:photosystem II stability/assembly factor-like uncharacterized protein
LDGNIWEERATGANAWLFAVTYGNKTIVATGENGAVLTSPDGITWTIADAVTDNDLMALTYTESKFWSVGKSGTVIVSSDGTNWQNIIGGNAGCLYGIAAFNSKAIAVGA